MTVVVSAPPPGAARQKAGRGLVVACRVGRPGEQGREEVVWHLGPFSSWPAPPGQPSGTAYTPWVLTLRSQDGSPDLLVADLEVDALYDALWDLAGKVDGALTAAAKVQHARHVSGAPRPSDYLTAAECSAVRAALDT